MPGVPLGVVDAFKNLFHSKHKSTTNVAHPQEQIETRVTPHKPVNDPSQTAEPPSVKINTDASTTGNTSIGDKLQAEPASKGSYGAIPIPPRADNSMTTTTITTKATSPSTIHDSQPPETVTSAPVDFAASKNATTSQAPFEPAKTTGSTSTLFGEASIKVSDVTAATVDAETTAAPVSKPEIAKTSHTNSASPALVSKQVISTPTTIASADSVHATGQ